MYAVIETGGKQYRVSPGQTLEVELLPAEPGSTVTLERVLLVTNEEGKTLVGAPLVPGGAVVGVVAREGRGKKILVFKYKSKKRYRRTRGHRQDYTYLLITDIQANGESLVPDEQRHRYERLAARQVARYERQLLGIPNGYEESGEESEESAEGAELESVESADEAEESE